MNKPSDTDLPEELREAPLAVPTLDGIIKYNPRGGSIDQGADVAKKALDLPAVPGGISQVSEEEAYRQKLIAANRALDGQVVNELGKGAIEGIALAGLAVAWTLFGWEVAALAGIGVAVVVVVGGRQ